MTMFSETVNHLFPSNIRNKLFDQPGMISFAAGKPDESIIPVNEIRQCFSRVLDRDGGLAFQYSDTEGSAETRARLCALAAHRGLKLLPEQLSLTSGSQQGIYFSVRLLVNKGDVVICENPTYTDALKVFYSCQARCIGIPMEKDGMKLDELETVLKTTDNVKMIYTIPDYQNPTGLSMSVEKRKRLVDLASRHRVLVIEDSPYGELRYEGDAYPAIKSFDTDGTVVYLGTFSKIISPGIRFGYVHAAPGLLEKYIMLKQVVDLQCGSINELLISELLANVEWASYISHVRDAYCKRRDLMEAAIKEFLPSFVSCHKPEGGFFYWLTLPKGARASDELMELAAWEEKVLFIAGSPFFINGEHENCIRLSFSNVPVESIEEGVLRLSRVLRKYCG